MIGLARSVRAARRRIAERIGGHPNDLVDLMVDAGALVAAADGSRSRSISPEETVAVLKAVRQLADLQGLRLRRASHRFDEVRKHLEHDSTARQEILDRVRRLRSKPHAAVLLLKIAEAIAAVDGTISEPERQELARLAEAVGVAPPGAPN